MKHLIVVNPKSFAKRSEMTDAVRDIREYFDSVKGSDYFIYISRYPRDAVSVIRKYVRETDKTVRVYSVGGDGILFDCLNGMAELENAELAVIPYGTTNDFVRAFGEGVSGVFRNIEKQATAGTIATDLINVGARHAINFCATGIEAAVVLKYYEISRRHPALVKRFGGFVYLASAPIAIMDKKIIEQEYEIIIDGERHRGRYAAINIANTPCYGGDKSAAPMACPTDGFLDVILTKSTSRPQLMRKITSYTKGRYYKYPKLFKHIRCKEIKIYSESPLYLNTDGEAYYDAHLEAKIVPNAVNIVAPDGLKYYLRREL